MTNTEIVLYPLHDPSLGTRPARTFAGNLYALLCSYAQDEHVTTMGNIAKYCTPHRNIEQASPTFMQQIIVILMKMRVLDIQRKEDGTLLLSVHDRFPSDSSLTQLDKLRALLRKGHEEARGETIEYEEADA